MIIELSGSCDPSYYLQMLRSFYVRINGGDYKIRAIEYNGLWAYPTDDDGNFIGASGDVWWSWDDIKDIYVY